LAKPGRRGDRFFGERQAWVLISQRAGSEHHKQNGPA
jgi:hypothetical protein